MTEKAQIEIRPPASTLALDPAHAYQTPLLVIVLLLIDGLHFVFARALRDYLPPVTAAFWMMAVASLQIGLYAAWRGRFRWTTVRKHARFFFVVGVLTAASTGITFTAISYIDPGTAALLNQTTTLFGISFGVFWLRERLSRWQLLGAAICIGGVAIITFQPGDFFRIGALLILCSSCFYALHAAVVKRYGAAIEFIEFFLWRVTIMAAFLWLASLGLGQWQWPSVQGWLWVIVAGTVDVVISRGLYYLALRRLNVSIHTLILTASPIVAMIWSYFLFSIQPGGRELLGGAAVLLGIAIVTTKRP